MHDYDDDDRDPRKPAETVDELIEKLRKILPPIFPRARIYELTGGVEHPGTLANLKSQGHEMPGSFRRGRNMVFFERDGYLEGLRGRIQAVKKSNEGGDS